MSLSRGLGGVAGRVVGEAGADEGTEVVAGGHGLAVGAAGPDGDEVAPADGGEKDVRGEPVGGLADGPDDVVGTGRLGGCEVLDGVDGLVEGGAEQVVHAGVADCAVFGRALLRSFGPRLL